MNLAQLKGSLGELLAVAALAAAVIAVCKAAGIGVPVRGSLIDWTYVAVACAAAKLAR